MWLSLKSISKHFDVASKTINVLSGVDLEVSKNQIISITGPSGSGKSSLLKIIGLLDEPDSGGLLFDGENCSHMNEGQKNIFRRSHLGFVFQNFNLLPDFSVLDNVVIPQIMNGKSSSASKKKALELLTLLQVDEHKHHLPSQISGGQQQRVAIARSLANEPTMILADEPTGNLDQENTDRVVEILVNIARKYEVTVVMVTHDINIAKKTDKIYLLESGTLKEFKG